MSANQNVRRFRRLNTKFCIVLAFPFIFSPLLFLGENSDKKLKCVYVIVLTIGYALLQAFPMNVASLVPIILLPTLGIMDTGAVISNYMKETTMICIGLSTLAIAIQRSNLPNRLIYKILLLTGSSPSKLLIGVLFGSALISMWFDGIFLVTVMFPIITAIAEELEKEKRIHFDDLVDQNELDDETVIVRSIKKKTLVKNEPLLLKRALLLSLVSAYNVGSRGTIYGSQNAIIYKQILESQGSFDKSELNFVSWSLYHIPIVLVGLVCCWLILVTYFFGIPCNNSKVKSTETSLAVKEGRNVENMLQQRYKDLGPLRFQEIGTLGMMIFLILLWFTREPKIFTGWNTLFPDKKVGDAVPAILIAFLLLILPYKWPRRNQPYETFISWKYLQDRFPWGVLFLIGGNFALSEAVVKSGLSAWIENQLGYLDDLPKEVIVLILMIIGCFLTEFMSGGVVMTVMYPIVMSMSWRLELHPLYLGMPVSLACNFGFTLPSATGYSALMFTLADGDVKISEMFKAGIGQTITCVFLGFFLNMWWGEYVFNYSEYSNSMNINSTITTMTP